jgi:4-amino-4-deoxy-L-arabinose transferase-like glycosyltransferase
VSPSDPSSSRRAATDDRLFRWLLAAAAPVFLVALGANSIWDANEAFYVETPKQMLLRGDYITPYFNDAQRLNKPVLSYWIVAGLYHLFGVSVGVERVGIALGALAIVGATFLVGRALRSTTVGLLAALIVATSPRVVMFARRIFIDIYITLFMALTLACFVMAERHPERRRRYLTAMYVAIGLGVLTKGPVALLLPGLAAAAWLTVERRWSDLRRLMIVPGLLIVVAIVVPWYAALFVRHGWDPIVGFFVGENVGRYTSSMAPQSRSVFFYMPVLFGDLFPWAPLVAIPLVSAWRGRQPGEDAPHASIRRLLWIWIVVFVGVFSLSQTKQDLYIFPIVPAVAALVADSLIGTGFGRDHRALRIALGAIAGLVAASSPVTWRLFADGYYRLEGTRGIATVLAIGGVAALTLLIRGRPRLAVGALAGTFIAFNYLFVGRALPSVERLKPVVPLAREFVARADSGARLGAFNLMLPSLVYYADRPVEVLDTIEQAAEFYRDPRGGWAIMDPVEFGRLRAVVPQLCVAARRPRSMFEADLRDLLAERPQPDVLLVTNRCGAGVRN